MGGPAVIGDHCVGRPANVLPLWSSTEKSATTANKWISVPLEPLNPAGPRGRDNLRTIRSQAPEPLIH